MNYFLFMFFYHLSTCKCKSFIFFFILVLQVLFALPCPIFKKLSSIEFSICSIGVPIYHCCTCPNLLKRFSFFVSMIFATLVNFLMSSLRNLSRNVYEFIYSIICFSYTPNIIIHFCHLHLII